MMKRLLVHFRGQMDEQLRPHGVTTAQLQILKLIRDEPGTSGAELARACHITPQSAQALVKHLETDGWIRREKDRVSDRILNAYLTPAGESLLETAQKAWTEIEARLWQGIDEGSIAKLNSLLERCLANVEPDRT
jgi:DNA-binding MarR family transcriptional regulator